MQGKIHGSQILKQKIHQNLKVQEFHKAFSNNFDNMESVDIGSEHSSDEELNKI